eukprot:TRINITY_DN733_c0_g1_i3.p1 TRINITY_DN733_c0_g1~~TRINITY_DN733_c0_g1_i3.p1  ORF type:complete len:1644 (+),score=370.88 TRINITY_DN733_c0_g1_i3:51-4934(+)
MDCAEILFSDGKDPPERVVFRVSATEDTPELAIKIIPKYEGMGEKLQLLLELGEKGYPIAAKVKNVVDPPGCECWWIVMECCDYSIGDAIYLLPTMSELDLKAIAFATLTSLSIWHTDRDDVHGNIKPNNLLLKEGELLLSDAGMSEFTECQHPAQIFPELEHYRTPLSSDIWALGISLIEISDKIPPFHNCSEEEILRRVQIETPELAGDVTRSDLFEDFLQQCLVKDHAERPNASMLLSHEWLQGVTEDECADVFEKMTEKLDQSLSDWNNVNTHFIHRSKIKSVFTEQVADTLKTSSSNSIQSDILEKAVAPRPITDDGDKNLYHPSQSHIGTDVLRDKTAGEFFVSLPEPDAPSKSTELLNLSMCTVYVLGRNVDVVVQNCVGCTIVIGPCSGTVRVEDCEECRINIAAKEVIISSCENIAIPMLYTSVPLQVEGMKASEIKVSPWNMKYANQEMFAKFANIDPYHNKWNEVDGEVDEDDHTCILLDPYALFPSQLELCLSGSAEGVPTQSCYKMRDLDPPVKCDDDNCFLVRYESQVNVVKRPGEVHATSIYLDNNNRSSFMFLDCLENVELRSLQSCLVILGPSDSITVEDCIGCVIIAMCETVTITTSTQCCLLLWSQSGCTVSQSSLEFGHFNSAWPLLDKQLEEKGWDLSSVSSSVLHVVDKRPTEPSEVFHLSQTGYQEVPVVDDNGDLIAPIYFPFPKAMDENVVKEPQCPPHQTIHPSKKLSVLQEDTNGFVNLYRYNQQAAITALQQYPMMGSPTPSSPSSPATPGSFLSGSSSPKSFPEEFVEQVPGSTSKRVVVRSLRRRRVLVPCIEGGDRFLFERVQHSEIFHVDPLPNNGIHESGVIRNCRNCLIVAAPVKGAIEIEECSNCVLVLSSNQIVIKGSLSCTLYLWCANEVLVHRCHGIGIFPWNVCYTNLQQQAVNAFGEKRLQQRSRHTKVFDLSRSDVRFPEPHFSMYSLRDVSLETLWGDEVFPFIDRPEGKLSGVSPRRVFSSTDCVESPEPPSPSVPEPAKIISPNTVCNVSDDRIERCIDSLNGSEFSVEAANRCQVIVADVASCVEAVKSTDSTFVFIAKESISLDSLTNCNVFAVAPKITATNLTSCRLHVFATETLALVTCAGITITPFNAKLPNLPTLFKKSGVDPAARNLFNSASTTSDCSDINTPDYIGLELQGFKLRKKLQDEPVFVPEIEKFLSGEGEPTGETDDRPLYVRAIDEAKNGITMKGPWDVPGSPLPLVTRWDEVVANTSKVSFYKDKTLILEDVAEKREAQVNFDNLKNCRIVVLGMCDSYMVDDCENCEFVLGPCKNSMFFRNCTNLCVTIACRQVRLRDVKDSEFFVHTETDPCVESSSGVILRPFNMRLPENIAAFKDANLTPEENRFRHAADFSRFSNPDIAIGFRIPDWVGVVKMRDIDLTGRGELNAPKGVEEILSGTCEGGESLEKGGGTFLMGEQGVSAAEAMRQFREREGIADDVSDEESTGPSPKEADRSPVGEIPVESEDEGLPPKITLPPSSTDLPFAPQDDFEQVEEQGRMSDEEEEEEAATPKKVSDAIINLVKDVKFCDPAILGLADGERMEYEKMIDKSKAGIAKMKTTWEEVAKLESNVDAMLLELGIEVS